MSSHSSPNPPRLAPSILAADHAELARGLERIESLPIKWLHLDIMDGHFVPNLSFGPQTVAALRQRNSSLFFDTHLMLSNPQEHLDAFIEAGSNLISVHVEPDFDTAAALSAIRKAGRGCGLVLNPDTPPEAALPFLTTIDLVLVMTVWPGFGGQRFIEDTLPKMAQLQAWRAEKGLKFRLEVDGGIDLHTAPRCHEQGVDTFVAGTAFFKAPDPMAFIAGIENPSA